MSETVCSLTDSELGYKMLPVGEKLTSWKFQHQKYGIYSYFIASSLHFQIMFG
jgi:hypothetical protein